MAGVFGPILLQLADPTRLFDLPGSVRGPLTFSVVLLLGAAILWRYDGLVDRSIDASVQRPLSSMGYGVAAHLTLLFAGAYLASQLAQLPLSGRSIGVVGVWAAVAMLAVAAGLGFTVVGSAVVELGLDRPRWQGVLVGAGLAGIAGLADPLVGGLLWVAAVSTGIGGPVRAWFLASEDVADHPE